jgi:hypothetical protein
MFGRMIGFNKDLYPFHCQFMICPIFDFQEYKT